MVRKSHLEAFLTLVLLRGQADHGLMTFPENDLPAYGHQSKAIVSKRGAVPPNAFSHHDTKWFWLVSQPSNFPLSA